MGCGASISSAGSPSSTPLYDSIADDSKAAKAADAAGGAGAGGARPSPGGGQVQRAVNQHAGVPPRPASRGGAVSSVHASVDAAGASSSAAAAAGVAGAVDAASHAAAAAAPHAAHAAVLQLQVANLSGSSATMGSSSASTPQPILSDSPAVHARTAQHVRGSLLKPVASSAAAAALTAAAAAAAATAPAGGAAAAAATTGDLQASSSSSHADSDSAGVLTASGVLVAPLPEGLPAFKRPPGAAAPAAAAAATVAAAAAATAATVGVAGTAGAATAGAWAAAPRPSQDAATNTSLSLTQASPLPHTGHQQQPPSSLSRMGQQQPALPLPHTAQQQRLQLPTTPGTPPAPPDTPSSLSGAFRSDAYDAEDPATESLRASAHVQLRPVPVLAPGMGAGPAGRYGSNQTDDDEGETPAARNPRCEGISRGFRELHGGFWGGVDEGETPAARKPR